MQRLTPLQINFVRLLQMNEPEIEAEVGHALDEMPALATDDDVAVASTDSGEEFSETAEQMQMADYKADDRPDYSFDPSRNNADYYGGAGLADDSASLYDLLMQQLRELPLTDRMTDIARCVVGNIDANGYLKMTDLQLADDLAINHGIDASDREVAEAVAIVRSLDPAGVGARDLQQCLMLQLQRIKGSDRRADIALEIVSNYFQELSLKHYDRIMRQLGIDDVALKDALALIRQLNPKPGGGDSSIYERNRNAITPDATVEITDDGRISIALSNRIPVLRIEQSFDPQQGIAATTGSRASSEASIFIKSRREEAQTFISALTMRQNTLFAVIKAIVDYQKPFFMSAEESRLRPMGLKDIAAATGLDMSTVSRATSGKYLSTPAGIFPMKYFFNERVQGSADDTEDTSSRQVVMAIKELIDGENKMKPLTDLELMAELEKMGLKVARRTVAKYRERQGIPIARLRREIR